MKRTKGEHLLARATVCSSLFMLVAAAAPAEVPLEKQLHDAKRFTASVTREFNRVRGNYVFHNAPVGNQILAAMTADRRDQVLPNGIHLVSGCRGRDCDAKAAVIARADGTALGAAIIHMPCIFIPKEECRSYVTIFVKPQYDRAAITQPLRAWADQVSVRLFFKPISGTHKVVFR